MGPFLYIGMAVGIILYAAKLLCWSILTLPFKKYKDIMSNNPIKIATTIGLFDLGFCIISTIVASILYPIPVVYYIAFIMYILCSLAYIALYITYMFAIGRCDIST